MKNLENTIQLLVSAKTIKGTSFIGVNGYENAKGEISNQTIVGGITYENCLVNDFQSLTDKKNDIFSDEKILKRYSLETIAKAYEELAKSLEIRLSSPEVKEALRLENNPTISRSDAQINAYIHVTKGVKIHKDSEQIHVFGLVVRKKVLKAIEYKQVNSRDLTLCKNDIQKFCDFKQSKFRTFIFEKANVKLQGIEIKNT